MIALDAVVQGTVDGIPVLAGIIAVLLVTIALVTLVNMMLALLPFMTPSPCSASSRCRSAR